MDFTDLQKISLLAKQDALLAVTKVIKNVSVATNKRPIGALKVC